jgi:ATP phosphoribosyltransferase regulatory subunit HisZ
MNTWLNNMLLISAIMVVAYLLHYYSKHQAYRKGLNDGLREGQRLAKLSLLVGRQQGFETGYQERLTGIIQKEGNDAELDFARRLDELAGK